MKEMFSTNIYIKNDAISAMEKNKNKNKQTNEIQYCRLQISHALVR